MTSGVNFTNGTQPVLARYSTRVRAVFCVPGRGRLTELFIAILGTAIAFQIGYLYSASHPVNGSWAQLYMSSAVNYACTGHFGPVRWASNVTLADTVSALNQMNAFLSVSQLDFSCDSFPQHLLAPTSFFDGIDASNTEQPLYLILLYGVLWSWFGLHWAVTHFILGAVVALSFLSIYFCGRLFMPPLVIAAVSLLFLSSPFFLTNILSPRDALKLPFAIGISALLIGCGTSPRPPIRFLLFACIVGVAIGIGFGFRSDLLIFLFPAAFITSVLGQIQFREPSCKNGLRKKTAIRVSAVAVLILSFGIGAWMPLANDRYFHEHYADMGYHPMVMGQLRITNPDLFQSHDDSDRGIAMSSTYMFRNAFNNDLSVGVRIMEYASRRYGENVEFAQRAYWTYAKRYYLDVISYIPADLVSGGIGAFINLMTLPANLLRRQSLTLVDRGAEPWLTAYGVARDTTFARFFVRPMDHLYLDWQTWSLEAVFFVNLTITFVFLCLVNRRLGFRSVVATVALLGTALSVVSLKFEMRHMFYIYAFSTVVWGSAIWLVLRSSAIAANSVFDRFHKRPYRPPLADFIGWLRMIAPSAKWVAGLALIISTGVYGCLLVARSYQENSIRSLIDDWLKRETVPSSWDVIEQKPGLSFIRVKSAMPTSAGGLRAADAPVTPTVAMGVVAIEFDGKACADRVVRVAAVGTSVPDLDTSFRLLEAFSVPFSDHEDRVAFLPAFYYRLQTTTMTFAGIEVYTQDVACVKSVKFVKEFEKGDLLFDFFVPRDVKKLRPDDLFQRVYIPGLGFI
jgi:hypothetical protein